MLDLICISFYQANNIMLLVLALVMFYFCFVGCRAIMVSLDEAVKRKKTKGDADGEIGD